MRGRRSTKEKSLVSCFSTKGREGQSRSPPLSLRLFWKFTSTESTLVFSSTYSSVAVKLGARGKMVNVMFSKLKIQKDAYLQQKKCYYSVFPDPSQEMKVAKLVLIDFFL